MRSALIFMMLFAHVSMGATSYYTAFPLTETPISQSGLWVNGAAQGIDWNNVNTTPGFAFGTQTGLEPCSAGNGCTDSTAVLSGLTWSHSGTITVQGTVHVTATLTGGFFEAEVRLNTTIGSHSITGYEVNCSLVSTDPYIQLVRWNGPLGNFTGIGSNSIYCVDGDTLKATITSAGVISVYHNGSLAFSPVTDTTYTSGYPGIGFFIGSTTNLSADFGLSSWWATDGVPVVTTTAVSGIGTSSAMSGGTVIDNGGASVTSEGVCYSTSANPISPCTSDGTATPFTSSLSGLSSGTLYHYRAFAANSIGTGYGPDLTFTSSSSSASGSNYSGAITIGGKVSIQ